MAFFIPVDLFGPFAEGWETGRKSVHDDRKQEQEHVKRVLDNIYTADTLDARTADTRNKAYDNYLKYQVNERRQPGELAAADLYNIQATDQLTVGQREDMRQANMDTLIHNIYAARNQARAARNQQFGGGGGGGGYVRQPAPAQPVAVSTAMGAYSPRPATEQGAGVATGNPMTTSTGEVFSWGEAAPQQASGERGTLAPPPTFNQPQQSTQTARAPLQGVGGAVATGAYEQLGNVQNVDPSLTQAPIPELYGDPDDPATYESLFNVSPDVIASLVEGASDEEIMQQAAAGTLPPGTYMLSQPAADGMTGIHIGVDGTLQPIYA